eukprot:CAMPEP_0175295102 /NCGR_PEP_ID=MMETSP0093-20121207/58343_1 /TAXON_ID=311494 /ORGANISM="Alexandrium monilatum, Strain CCMP3105" /LENGTH=44 /DNA_ID= /DNA_START= /DNA_END= /DNA_ORIENTATION=
MTNLHHVRFDVRRQFKRPVLVPAVATTAAGDAQDRAPSEAVLDG